MSLFTAQACAAKASLASTRSRSATFQPAFFSAAREATPADDHPLRARRAAMAADDPDPEDGGSDEPGVGAAGAALFALVGDRPELRPHLPVILYETLGPTLPDGAAAALFIGMFGTSAASSRTRHCAVVRVRMRRPTSA